MASQQKSANNVTGGLKAAMHNSNVSEETKQNVQQRLEKMQSSTGAGPQIVEGETGFAEGDEFTPDSKETSSDQNPNRVMGGYKATLKNPHVSQDAKQKSEKILKDNDAL